jgi:hypothetical protein
VRLPSRSLQSLIAYLEIETVCLSVGEEFRLELIKICHARRDSHVCEMDILCVRYGTKLAFFIAQSHVDAGVSFVKDINGLSYI